MVRTALIIALAAATIGCGRERAAPPPPSPPVIEDAAGARPVAVDAAGRPRPFVDGVVVIAARHGGLVRPLRLDPATGAWQPLGSGEDHLFPTASADGEALLVVAAHGEHEGDHVEQLAWVRGAAVERFGPRAGAIRHPAWHPTGDAVVFESSLHSFRDLYRLTGSAAERRLTDDAAGNFEPALSPDGRSVVFSSSRDGDAELYRVPAAGGRATRLTASARDDWGARWSPDGRRLVFLSDREGPPRAFVMDADGTDLRRLTAETDPAVAEEAPRWSPDGTTIALIRGQASAAEVVLVAVLGRTARTLTPAGASDTDLAWSPDGAHLLLARHQPPAGPAEVTFVRISDSAVVATDPIDPLALRWFSAPRAGP